MNRTDRLFAILLEIQSTPKITSQQLAQRFDVTKRTIYRDVLALMEANVPVRGKAGEGYSIDDDYFLPPVSFTKDEALMLILGAGTMGQHFDAQFKNAARTAENKINASLSKGLKREVAYLKSYIAFFSGANSGKGEVSESLRKIRGAIIEKKSVAFRYFKRYAETSEPMVREVDPYALTNFYGNWALSGYDHLRKAIRMFRLDRMETVMVTAKTFERPKNFRFSDLAKQETAPRSIYHVKVSRDILRWVKEQPPYIVTKIELKREHALLSIESSNERSLILWLLRWGNKAEAVSPASFRSNVKQMLTEILQQYP